MKKFLLPLSLSGVLLFAACNSAPIDTDTDDTTSSSSSEAMEQSASSDVSDSSAMTQSSATSQQAGGKTVTVVAANFTFTPNVIRVKKGEKLTLKVESSEGDHGFAVKDLGINVVVDDGVTKTIEIPTDTAGTFTFYCSVPCGPGHKEMKGTIIIE